MVRFFRRQASLESGDLMDDCSILVSVLDTSMLMLATLGVKLSTRILYVIALLSFGHIFQFRARGQVATSPDDLLVSGPPLPLRALHSSSSAEKVRKTYQKPS